MKLEMKSSFIKSLILAILGCIFLGFGIGMAVKVGIGSDSLSAVYNALTVITGYSLGTVTVFANIVMTTLSFLLNKKNVGAATIAFLFVSKWPVDFMTKIYPTSDNLIISIILYVIACLTIAFGSDLFIISSLGSSSYDGISLGIDERLNHKYKFVYIRWCIDGLLLVLAIILKGKIGIGTIISLIIIGPLMKFLEPILKRLFKVK